MAVISVKNAGSKVKALTEDKPRVGVIVLHWNAFDETSSCIQSLSKLRYENHMIIVVDNGSVIPLQDQLNEQYLNIRIVRSSENVGFAAGCNVGINAVIEQGCEFVWLLNNDTIVDRDALSYLIEKAKEERSSGIVGSTILEKGNESIVNHVGGWVYPYLGLCVHLGKGEQYELVQKKRKIRPKYITGCSMLARVEMIQELGLMDEGYFLYWEDADWCLRAKKRGWNIAMAYESIVYHKGSSGLGATSPLKGYYLARNSLRFVFKFYPWLFPLAIIWWPRRHFINHLLKGRFTHAKMALRGGLDFVKGRVVLPETEGGGTNSHHHKMVQLRK